MISSASNEKIKDIKKLMKSSKYRQECGLYIVEGIRMYKEIPEEDIKYIFVSESAVKKFSENEEINFNEDEKNIFTTDSEF